MSGEERSEERRGEGMKSFERRGEVRMGWDGIASTKMRRQGNMEM